MGLPKVSIAFMRRVAVRRKRGLDWSPSGMPRNATMSSTTLSPVIRMHPEDGVVIARQLLQPGTEVTPGVTVGARRIPAGHKVAVRPIAKGEPIRRYGQIIGFATDAIEPGAWVHTHNCEMGDFARDYAW